MLIFIDWLSDARISSLRTAPDREYDWQFKLRLTSGESRSRTSGFGPSPHLRVMLFAGTYCRCILKYLFASEHFGRTHCNPRGIWSSGLFAGIGALRTMLSAEGVARINRQE